MLEAAARADKILDKILEDGDSEGAAAARPRSPFNEALTNQGQDILR
jgi:hypothetical protein